VFSIQLFNIKKEI